ncbi:MAG TPA: type II toxin-antitoxin system PemK/MazF family toxin [Gemmatimonadaceae bacterium]|nr:type II toxin-antitoxin system PemK/MazF family toxin [Gemmatimonadaceae bacterium]
MVKAKVRLRKVSRPRRFDVILVDLDPTLGSEIRKTRPCVVVSPDEINAFIDTVVVAPMTTGTHAYPTRIPCTFRRRTGYVVIDQLRTIDTTRVVRLLGAIDAETQKTVLRALASFFAP